MCEPAPVQGAPGFGLLSERHGDGAAAQGLGWSKGCTSSQIKYGFSHLSIELHGRQPQEERPFRPPRFRAALWLTLKFRLGFFIFAAASQVNTLPKAKSETRSKQNKDMYKCSSVYSERGVPLPVLTSGGE